MKRQPESVADFKARITKMMRERETGKRYSVIGAAPADSCVVRKTYAPHNGFGNKTNLID